MTDRVDSPSTRFLDRPRPSRAERSEAGSPRADLVGFALALGAAAAVLALVALCGAGRIVFGDEIVYATAARELAQGRPPIAHGVTPIFVLRFGFPYHEFHAGGGVMATALAFRILGATAHTAVVPAAVATVLTTLLSYAVARRVGLGPGPATFAATLVAWAPTTAAFALSGFYEPALALSLALGAAALLARRLPARLGLAALACALGVSYRETTLVLPVALALAAFALDRARGRSARDAAPPAVALALVGLGSGLLALRAASGHHLAPRNGSVLPWYIAVPCLGAEAVDECVARGLPAPRVTLWLLAERAALMLPKVFVRADALPGSAPTLRLVHVSAALATLGLARRHSPEVRALSLLALALYLVKTAFLVLVYEAPMLYARHLAPEAVLLVLASVAAVAARLPAGRARFALAGAILLGALGLDAVVATTRARIAAELDRAATVLARHAPPGGALLAGFEYHLAWRRPDLFHVAPPGGERAFMALLEQVPIERLVLGADEQPLATALAATGRIPSRLGPFALVTIDRSLGAPLFVYHRADAPSRKP